MDKPTVLTTEQRTAVIADVAASAEALAQEIDWRTDPRLQQTWTSKGRSKTLELRMQVSGTRFICLLDNEGGLFTVAIPGQASRPVSLATKSDAVLIELRDTLTAALKAAQ